MRKIILLLILSVLLLNVLCKKYVVKIYEAHVCENQPKKSIAELNNITLTEDSDGSTRIVGILTVKENVPNFKVSGIVRRCSDRINLNTCIDFLKTPPIDFYLIAFLKDQPWSELTDFKPPLVRGQEKGRHLVNGTAKFNQSKYIFPLAFETYLWHFNIQFLSNGKFIGSFCLSMQQVEQKKRPRHMK